MPENLNFAWGNSLNFANAGAVAGTGFSLTTTAATAAVINGKFTTPYAAASNAAIPTVDWLTGLAFNAVPPASCCAIVFGVNLAGALKVVQGRVIPTSNGVGNTPGQLINAPQFPGLPEDFCPIAYTIMRSSAAAAAWTPGASAWAATGVLCSTFQNVAQLPNRPQTS